MARLFVRLGGIVIVADFLYLAIAEAFGGGARPALFRNGLKIGGLGLALGFVFWLCGLGMAGIANRSCPRCGRRVARGKVYCDEHFQETINEYRDQQRGKEG